MGDWNTQMDNLLGEALDLLGGVTGTYQPAPPVGVPFAVKALEFSVREPESVSPGVYRRFTVRAVDFVSAPVAGDELTVAGIIYKVVTVEPEVGTRGIALLVRQK